LKRARKKRAKKVELASMGNQQGGIRGLKKGKGDASGAE